MPSIPLKTLLGKLNPLCLRALEAAAAMCVGRTHFQVEVEHFLLKLVEARDADVPRILAHYGIEPRMVAWELTRAIDKLRTGNTGAPAFSDDLVAALGDAWTIASARLPATQIRSGHLFAAMVLTDGECARRLLDACHALAKIPAEPFATELPALLRGGVEEPVASPAGPGPAPSVSKEQDRLAAEAKNAPQRQQPGVPPGQTDGDWKPGAELLGDYVIEKPLGEGGMGLVYLVRSKSTGQRFAVKRAKLPEAEARRNFIAELQTWIDLPDHPNVVACRFFRTVADEIAIFAEYVPGGSLGDWIRDRRLTQLDQLLQVAIQFAWGLHVLHECGLVHQDVKPGNVLMDANGRVKIADFGLSRARARAGADAKASGHRSILVSAGGMTPAYCSPEQAQGGALDRTTDVWSWAVSVLELFTGEVYWRSGTLAPEVLEAYVSGVGPAADLPPMPAGLAGVLRKCFALDPAQRWRSLHEVVDILQKTFFSAPARGPSLAPLPARRRERLVSDRRLAGDGSAGWRDPREWLAKALEFAGEPPARAFAIPHRGDSLKAQVIGDLAVFEEAYAILSDLIARGQEDIENAFASLCLDKAYAHEAAEDLQGAIKLHDEAIAIHRRRVEQEGRRELAADLARAYRRKAIAVGRLGDARPAVPIYDQAIAIFKRLVEQEGRHDLFEDLALTYTNKALALDVLGDSSKAVQIHNQAIAIFERLMEQAGQRKLDEDLAAAYINKAVAVRALGDCRTAVQIYDQAIAVFKRLVEQERRCEFELGTAYMNKAIALDMLRDNGLAVSTYDQAIAIFKRLVEHGGRRELTHNLARAYLNKANALDALGDSHAAVQVCDQAIAIFKRLVEQEDRRDLAHDLARACLNKAHALDALGDRRTAVQAYDQTIAIFKRLVEQEGRREFANELANAYLNKAAALEALGDRSAALRLFDQTIAIYKSLVTGQRRQEFLGDLAKAQLVKACVQMAMGDIRASTALVLETLPALEAEIARTGREDLQRARAIAQNLLQAGR